jgi:hypothetical protein
MRRLVWVAVGAVGGIYAYRRGSALVADARERGVVLTAQQAAFAAMSTLASARELAGRVNSARMEQSAGPVIKGRAAARVVSERDGR